MGPALTQLSLPLPHLASGKVREVYAVDDHYLLFVASDRLSAFDVVMASGIPGKGQILTQLASFWFAQLANLGPHHLVSDDINDLPASLRPYRDQLRGRTMLVRRCRILPVEAIVRGHLAGSGWKEYQRSHSVCGIPLTPGLQEAQALPKPLFTPSTKAALGSHDENISPHQAALLLGDERAAEVAARSLAAYSQAHAFASERGLILADTKFEFGLDDHDRLILADEVLTPDSSRYWPADGFTPGKTQPSFDKQFVRDYLESINYDKTTPITLPDSVIAGTRDRYCEAFRRLTGQDPIF